MAAAVKSPQEYLPLALESAAGQFTVQCDRRWHQMNDDPKLLGLRFVDRGDLVAQCNVAVVDKAEPGKHIDLSKFQQEIQQKLGDNFGQFVANGLRCPFVSGLPTKMIVGELSGSDDVIRTSASYTRRS